MSGAGALLVIGVAALALALGALVVVLRRVPARVPATSNAALLADQAQADAEATAARRLVERRIPGTRGLPADQRTRRLAGMLARKGYPAGLAYRVIKEALEAEGESAALEDEPTFDFEDSDTE